MTDCVFTEGALGGRKNDMLSKLIGATAIFEGTVREDIIEGYKVKAIEFSTQPQIAKSETLQILNKIKQRYQLINALIYHSTGIIKPGEICFRVIVESAHRKEAFEALPVIVDEFKASVPVFGKEILENNTHVWKKNK